MDDLISRQALIAEFNCCEYTPDGGIDANYAIEFLEQLPAAQPGPRWIPCAERTPTRNDHKDGMVLVCHATGLIRFGAYIDGEWVTGEPIAWMPLPEPYEEEQDEQGAG